MIYAIVSDVPKTTTHLVDAVLTVIKTADIVFVYDSANPLNCLFSVTNENAAKLAEALKPEEQKATVVEPINSHKDEKEAIASVIESYLEECGLSSSQMEVVSDALKVLIER